MLNNCCGRLFLKVGGMGVRRSLTKSFLLVARRGDPAVSTRKMTEEAAEVGAGSGWEGQREVESSKPGNFVPTGPAQRAGSGGKGSGRGATSK